MGEQKIKVQLQGIKKPHRDICRVKEMYFHKQGKKLAFNGFFNLFYIEKWKRYTALERLYLSIQVCGYKRLMLYHDKTCIETIALNARQKNNYEIKIPLEQYDQGVFWFALIEAENKAARSCAGFYAGECKQLRDVTIGVTICTFHREEFVQRNLQLLTTSILNNRKVQIADHLWIYIVDNGETLEQSQPVQQLACSAKGRVRIIANKNAGGAGGFTRGMLQILKEKQEKNFTHILLMDDDVRIEPDLFVRLYGFLRICKEEWKDLSVGGMMLREENPYQLFAAGEKWEKGIIFTPEKGIDLRRFKNAAGKGLMTTCHEKEYYSGWWCCCYPLSVVREDNLPIPLFLHHDDIEFGLRIRHNGIVFLNGISVWHPSFEDRPPGSNLYYDIRNDLIEIALQYEEQKASNYLWRFYWKRLAVRLVKGKWKEIVFIIQGAQDFLKGPKWLWQQNPVTLHEHVKRLEIPTKTEAWRISVSVCRKLLKERKKAVLDYQKHMYQYTTKKAWVSYLGLTDL